MSPLQLLAAGYASIALMLGLLIWRAPEGFEDARGWHSGPEPFDLETLSWAAHHTAARDRFNLACEGLDDAGRERSDREAA